MSALRWLPLAVLPPCAVLVTLALESCGSLCGRAEPRSDCPCAPGEGDSATSGGGNDDGGCGRALKVRCECGVTGGDSGGDADTEATEDTDATTDATTDTTGDAVCDVDTPVTLYLSADDSNSMSSPVQARIAALSDWFSLGAVPIRPWEFFNYYDFDYPAAPPGEVALFMEMIPNAAEVGAYTLQIGVSSEVYDQEPRPPVTVTFVLDTSGSMAGAPIEALREVCRAITASLRAGDRVSMVTWNSENTIVLDDYPVIGPQDPTLLDAIAGLEAGGSTDLHGGLSAGYALASKSAGPGRASRVLLISDGGANTGVTDIDLIASYAGAEDEDGIYLVGVGVGSAETYRDTLMDQVTDVGKGASVFIPDKEEAWKMFSARFQSTLLIAARDVQVRLDMPPGFSIQRFSGEEYSSDPSEVEPQHLAVADAMIFHQTVATCAPEVVLPTDTVTVTARYLDADTFEAREVSLTRTFAELEADASPRLKKGQAVMAYADALTAARLDADDLQEKVAAASAAVDAAAPLLPGDPVLTELSMVLQAL